LFFDKITAPGGPKIVRFRTRWEKTGIKLEYGQGKTMIAVGNKALITGSSWAVSPLFYYFSCSSIQEMPPRCTS